MIVRGGGGFLGKVLWAFFVCSVAFAIIGDPTVGPEQFKQNLIKKADGFKSFIDTTTRDLRNGNTTGGGSGGTGGPSLPPQAGGTTDTKPVKDTTPKQDTDALSALTVTSKALGGYNRDDWNHWIDIRPCWSVRDEVLYRDADAGSQVLVDKTGKKTTSLKSACGLAAGTWHDPYSKLVFTKPSDLDIDHLVPLENANRSGAASWSKSKKEAYANNLADPDHLRAVASSENRSKSAQSPATWQPIDRSKHCWYARSWVRIKAKWDLTIVPAEKAALKDMLSTC